MSEKSAKAVTRSRAGKERTECYNPLCTETLTCDPDAREGYCSWDCAVMACSGAANRILREGNDG